MRDYPANLAPAHAVEPVPRRLRGFVAGRPVFDTTAARYVWEAVNYPTYYVPLADVDPAVLVDEERVQHTRRGPMNVYGLRVGAAHQPAVGRVPAESEAGELATYIRFDWPALDAWFEEDERVYVHPRNPYVRVDALRSTRAVRIEVDGVVLADCASPVMLFETGLPTRYYLNPADVDFTLLEPTDTVTECPYKGTTSGYWAAQTADGRVRDIAWRYAFPTAAVLPVAGLVAFYNERVDTFVDGQLLERPQTHFA